MRDDKDSSYMWAYVLGAIVIYGVFFKDGWLEGIASIVRLGILFGPLIFFWISYGRLKIAWPKVEKWWMVCVVLLFAVGWGWRALFEAKISEERPGALFEKSTYRGRFYVHAYPGVQKVKNYKIPALVEAEWDSVDDGDSSNSFRVYRLIHIEFPSGGKIDFSSDESLHLNKEETFIDEEGNRWNILLTSERVK